MPCSFFISAPPNDTALNNAYDAINSCILNGTPIKQIFIFNHAARLFMEDSTHKRWRELLKATQSDVIICSKAAANAQLDNSMLPSNASIAGMASFVESINNDITVHSFRPSLV